MTAHAHRKVCLSAAFGGIATSVFGLAVDLTANQRGLPTTSYLVGLALFAVIGGAIAYFFEETSPKKAFFLGLGVPSLIQVGAANLTQPAAATVAETATATRRGAFSLLPLAHAADGGPAPGRKVRLTWSGSDGPRAFEIVFRDPAGRRHERVRVAQPSGRTTLDVPDYAASFWVQVGSTRSASQTLPPTQGQTSSFELEVRDRAWSGFRRAIGIRDVSEVEVILKR